MEHETSGNSSLHISDVIEVIQTTDPDFADDEYNPLFSVASPPGEGDKQHAYVEITEQPAAKALRFRYECEGRSAGSIPGASSTPDNKTYPAIRVVGYVGRAVVVVSCVTKESPYRPHPHSLVGKEGCKRGVCTLELSDDMTATFSNLGIQCVKKRDIDEALRVREEIRVDPFRTGFAHRNQPGNIDLNAVRLCFQVFLEGSEKGKFTFQLTPVVSDPIYDKKAMSDLVICKMSDCSASVAGGKEIILLCEKVAKEDIQVRFFEQDHAGRTLWEAQGDFTPAHVHKQVAISLRTPRYRTLDVPQPVDACIQLRRPSDGASSEPLPFQLLPLDSGRSWLRRKAKGDYTTFSSILASNTALLTGGAAMAVDSVDRTRPFLAMNPPPLLAQVPPVVSASTDRKMEPAKVVSGSGIPSAPVSGVVESKVSEGEKPMTASVPSPEEMKQVEVVKIETVKVSNKDENANNMNNSTSIEEVTMDQDSRKQNYDYADVQKEKSLPTDKFTENLLEQLKNEENLRNNDVTEACQSINELLSQVTGFESGLGVSDAMEVDDFYDDQTYSSLQLAMKNPIQLLDDLASEKYEDVMTVPYNAQSPLISIVPSGESPLGNKRTPPPTPTTPDSKLPPLPPKRFRKDPPAPPARPEAPPNKTLPPPPAPAQQADAAPKQSNKSPGIFSKLFSKKSSKSKKDSTPRGSISEASQQPSQSATPRGSISEPVSPPTTVDLTEAEHYALYTDMAPKATASEFDESSFYYSPVEGGNIINPQNQGLKQVSGSQQDVST
nr:dorsal-like protein [Gryllodes sigillatus]